MGMRECQPSTSLFVLRNLVIGTVVLYYLRVVDTTRHLSLMIQLGSIKLTNVSKRKPLSKAHVRFN